MISSRSPVVVRLMTGRDAALVVEVEPGHAARRRGDVDLYDGLPAGVICVDVDRAARVVVAGGLDAVQERDYTGEELPSMSSAAAGAARRARAARSRSGRAGGRMASVAQA